MWFEIAIIPLIIIVLVFIIFWIVKEGSRWQKHRYVGVFARFIQTSPRRSFFIFLILTFLMIPADLMMTAAYWYESISAGIALGTTPIVAGLLLMFLLLALMMPVVWGTFRLWRQSVRAAAEVRVRSTSD